MFVYFIYFLLALISFCYINKVKIYIFYLKLRNEFENKKMEAEKKITVELIESGDSVKIRFNNGLEICTDLKKVQTSFKSLKIGNNYYGIKPVAFEEPEEPSDL